MIPPDVTLSGLVLPDWVTKMCDPLLDITNFPVDAIESVPKCCVAQSKHSLAACK